MITETIECGDHIRVIGNAKGSIWETGHVMDINEELGVLIRYDKVNDGIGNYATERKVMCDLIKIEGD